MPGNAKDVKVDVLAKDSTRSATQSAGKNFDGLAKKVEAAGKAGEGLGVKFKKGIESLAVPAAAIGTALVALAVQAGKAASDAQQSIGAVQTVFGKASADIIAKSKAAAEKYGLSANSYRDSANLIGSLLKNQGVGQDKLAGQTDTLISKASDLAAVFGGSTSDAVEALTSALKGEFDPLEKYGVSLTQATIDAEALTQAHVGSVAEFNKLTPAQQKAAQSAATLALINKQSADAQGQFAAQTGTAAEKAQIVKARYENLSATLGEKLLPMFDKLLVIGGQVLSWAEKNKPIVIALAIAVGLLALAVVAMNIAMYANPIVLVVAAIALLIVGFVVLYQKCDRFRAGVDALWSVMRPFYAFMINFWIGVAQAVAAFVVGAYDKVNSFVGFIKGLPGRMGAAARGMFDGFQDAFRSAFNWIIGKWNDLHFTIPGVDTHIPGVGTIGGFTLNTPDIPRFSAGGGGWSPAQGGTVVHVAPAAVDNHIVVELDGRPFRAMARAEAQRTAWRAKVGTR